MTAVMLLGDIPSTGYLVGTAAERVTANARASEEAGQVLEYMEYRLRESESIVALYPTWQAAGARKLIKLARNVLATDQIAAVPLNLPPLAMSFVADQAAYLAPHLQAGHLASVAHSLAATMSAGAWTRSVTKLEHIDTKMGDHLASFLPNETFVVTAAPKSAIHRMGGHKIPDLGFRPPEPIHLLITQGDITWFQESLQNLLRPGAVKVVPPQPLGLKFWGNKRYIEFVAFSGHPSALSQIANATRCWPCKWCDRQIGLQTCPFCGMSQVREQAALTSGASAPPPRQQQPALPAVEPAHSNQHQQPHPAQPAHPAHPPQPTQPPQPAHPVQPVHQPAQPAEHAPPPSAHPQQPAMPMAAPVPTPANAQQYPQQPSAHPSYGSAAATHAEQPAVHPSTAYAADQRVAPAPATSQHHPTYVQPSDSPTIRTAADVAELHSTRTVTDQTIRNQSPAAAVAPPQPPAQPAYPPGHSGYGPQDPKQAARQLRVDPQWNGGGVASQATPGQFSSQYPSAVDTVRGATSTFGSDRTSTQTRNDHNWPGSNPGGAAPRYPGPNGHPQDRVSP